MKPHHYEPRWGLIVAGVILLFFSFVAHFQSHRAASLDAAFDRARVITAIRVDLFTASAAEQRALIANDADDARRDVAEARVATVAAEAQRALLGTLLLGHERAQLAELDSAFAEYARLDGTVVALAAENTDGRATALTYGPARDALDGVDRALSVIIGDAVQLTPARGREVATRASAAQAALLRIAILLPPHIAEAQPGQMDALEKQIADQQAIASEALDAVAPLLRAEDGAAMDRARDGYARFMALESQIVTLSRENSNVRALALVRQKQNALDACMTALDALDANLNIGVRARSLRSTP